jgi:hypothetical protein
MTQAAKPAALTKLSVRETISMTQKRRRGFERPAGDGSGLGSVAAGTDPTFGGPERNEGESVMEINSG